MSGSRLALVADHRDLANAIQGHLHRQLAAEVLLRGFDGIRYTWPRTLTVCCWSAWPLRPTANRPPA